MSISFIRLIINCLFFWFSFSVVFPTRLALSNNSSQFSEVSLHNGQMVCSLWFSKNSVPSLHISLVFSAISFSWFWISSLISNSFFNSLQHSSYFFICVCSSFDKNCSASVHFIVDNSDIFSGILMVFIRVNSFFFNFINSSNLFMPSFVLWISCFFNNNGR